MRNMLEMSLNLKDEPATRWVVRNTSLVACPKDTICVMQEDETKTSIVLAQAGVNVNVAADLVLVRNTLHPNVKGWGWKEAIIDIDTTGFNQGDPAYLSDVTAGELIFTAPADVVIVGVIVATNRVKISLSGIWANLGSSTHLGSYEYWLGATNVDNRQFTTMAALLAAATADTPNGAQITVHCGGATLVNTIAFTDTSRTFHLRRGRFQGSGSTSLASVTLTFTECSFAGGNITFAGTTLMEDCQIVSATVRTSGSGILLVQSSYIAVPGTGPVFEGTHGNGENGVIFLTDCQVDSPGAPLWDDTNVSGTGTMSITISGGDIQVSSLGLSASGSTIGTVARWPRFMIGGTSATIGKHSDLVLIDGEVITAAYYESGRGMATYSPAMLRLIGHNPVIQLVGAAAANDSPLLLTLPEGGSDIVIPANEKWRVECVMINVNGSAVQSRKEDFLIMNTAGTVTIQKTTHGTQSASFNQENTGAQDPIGTTTLGTMPNVVGTGLQMASSGTNTFTVSVALDTSWTTAVTMTILVASGKTSL